MSFCTKSQIDPGLEATLEFFAKRTIQHFLGYEVIGPRAPNVYYEVMEQIMRAKIQNKDVLQLVQLARVVMAWCTGPCDIELLNQVKLTQEQKQSLLEKPNCEQLALVCRGINLKTVIDQVRPLKELLIKPASGLELLASMAEIPKRKRSFWSREEEDCLEMAMGEFGARYSLILHHYGKDGVRNQVLRNRGQMQLKDKARNMRLRLEKQGIDPGPFIHATKYCK